MRLRPPVTLILVLATVALVGSRRTTPARRPGRRRRRASDEYAGRVAFLGVDMQDEREAALAFMDELPTGYPHYFDEDGSISRLFGGGHVSPTTGFYDAAGRLVFTHLGAYADDAQLDAEIRLYALG